MKTAIMKSPEELAKEQFTVNGREWSAIEISKANFINLIRRVHDEVLESMGFKCVNCGKPATCIGRYEDATKYSPACDECCGHGNEDGHCIQISDFSPLPTVHSA